MRHTSVALSTAGASQCADIRAAIDFQNSWELSTF
jgi:hypothetical protein